MGDTKTTPNENKKKAESLTTQFDEAMKAAEAKAAEMNPDETLHYIVITPLRDADLPQKTKTVIVEFGQVNNESNHALAGTYHDLSIKMEVTDTFRTDNLVTSKDKNAEGKVFCNDELYCDKTIADLQSAVIEDQVKPEVYKK